MDALEKTRLKEVLKNSKRPARGAGAMISPFSPIDGKVTAQLRQAWSVYYTAQLPVVASRYRE